MVLVDHYEKVVWTQWDTTHTDLRKINTNLQVFKLVLLETQSKAYYFILNG